MKTRFYFREDKPSEKEGSYLIGLIRGVFDPASELYAPDSIIAQALAPTTQLPDEMLLQAAPIFHERGHQVLLAYTNEELIGHTAFQAHPESWQVYSHFITPDFRHNGYATDLATILLKEAIKAGIQKVRFGKGDNENMTAVLKKLQNSPPANWSIDPETGWTSK